jgi:carboxynorspermidine decarboxylase
VWEARLAREEFGGEVHAYAPAYKPEEIDQLRGLVNHISFNSLNQWRRYRDAIARTGISPGLRINPEHREAEVALYDPAAPGSRLGVRRAQLQESDLEGLEGFHIHNLCECGPEALERTMAAFEGRFGDWIPRMKWINFGGGHLMTRSGYDIDRLVAAITGFRKRHGVEVILEPGSAVAWQTGPLLCEVVDIVHNELDIAILDISATAHMPDVLEMPYRPLVRGADEIGVKPHNYRLGGNSCLAGDVIGDYSFDQPLQPGDRLLFEDMIHYTMVKTSFFNGVQHPAIGMLRKDGSFELVRRFEYPDFRARLG